MNITTLDIDIAKQVFQLHCTDGHGKVTLRKRLRRNQLLTFMQQLRPCLVGWVHTISSDGYLVYLKTHKGTRGAHKKHD